MKQANESSDTHPSAGSLRLQQARFAYPHCQPLLNDIDLEIHAHERLHIAGDNGSGKSTLLSLLVGLHTWQSGEMEVNGRSITSTADYAWLRQHIGFVSQDPRDHLFCPSVGDDCRFGPRNYGCSREESEARCHYWLGQLGIAHLIDHPASQLSAGQAQLAALAAVCCCHPNILLLDEPSSALDQQHRDTLIACLGQGPWTICFTSHDQALTEAIATRKLVLHQGSLHKVE